MIMSGHVDGAIYMFSLAGQPTKVSIYIQIIIPSFSIHMLYCLLELQVKFVQHSCVPQALAWGENVVAAGTDSKVVFYDGDGLVAQKFDYSQDEKEKEYTCASCSPSGQSIVLGSFNRYKCYTHIFFEWGLSRDTVICAQY